MDAIRQSNDEPRWLYRADTRSELTPSLQPLTDGIRAELWSPKNCQEELSWGTDFRKSTSMPLFLSELQRHLKKIVAPCETYLVSMTPHLEWAVHRTGQKCHPRSPFHKLGENGLAIIDAHHLRNSDGTIVLRVTDIITYADSHAKSELFDTNARKWAANCDEYVAINHIPYAAIVNWTPWSVMYQPTLSSSLISESFTTLYTLGLWKKNRNEDRTPLDAVAKRVAYLAMSIVKSGPPNTNFEHDVAISLIVNGSDWGYTAFSDRSRLVAASMLYIRIEMMKDEFQRLYVQS